MKTLASQLIDRDKVPQGIKFSKEIIIVALTGDQITGLRLT
jgi:hypothetical protein